MNQNDDEELMNLEIKNLKYWSIFYKEEGSCRPINNHVCLNLNKLLLNIQLKKKRIALKSLVLTKMTCFNQKNANKYLNI